MSAPLLPGSSHEIAPRTGTNRIIVALRLHSPLESAWLAPHLEHRQMAQGEMIAPAGVPPEYVHFPESAVMSVISRMANGDAAEVGTVGNEGMLGLSAFLGGGASLHETVVQVAGASLRARASLFAGGAEQQPVLRRLMGRYTLEYLGQVAQTAACNRLHAIEPRCARWLLMTHDRVGRAAQFELTQEYLAIMLGVRRGGVTVAAGALQDAGLIRYRRGGIRVLDRDGLEAAACECYGVVREHFDRALG